MNNIQVFSNPDFGEIRSLLIDNEPWFVGKDVAVALGYESPSATVSKKVDNEDKRFVMLNIADFQNGNVVAAHVDEEDRTTTLIQGTGSNYKSKTVIINESGLYSLILSSKLPTVKKFKHWATICKNTVTCNHTSRCLVKGELYEL